MDKKEKKKGVLQTIREVNQKELDEQIKMEEEERIKKESAEAKEREEYEQKLKNERLELLKMKQGISTEEMSKEETVKKNYTFFQKIENFMYLNKTYVILGAIVVFIVGYLTIDLLKREDYDVGMMILTNDNQFETNYKNLRDLCQENMTIDANEDGKLLFSSYYMPLDPEVNDRLNGANSAKLYALLQGNDTMLVVCDDTVETGLNDIAHFEDLSAIFPDNSHIDGYRFNLKDTKMLKEIGFENSLAQPSTYIALRKVSNNLKPKENEKMQKYYDAALEVLKVLVEQYS